MKMTILYIYYLHQAYVILPEGLLDNLSHSKGDAGNDEIFAKKGPVFATAVVSGVMAAKKTSDFIPFCHQVGLDRCDIDIRFDDTARNRIRIDCTVSCTHKTGVEMEALVGASHAALTIYDMMKALSHSIEITEVKLIKKTGGKSDYLAAS
jgi:cyclic pyranopterin phosphate synthase